MILGKVILDVKNDWNKDKYQWEYSTMIKHSSKARLFTMSGYLIMFVSFIGFVITPYFGFEVRIINNITDIGDNFLPLQTFYPFDITNQFNFKITYFIQAMAGVFVGIGFSVPDNFFGALVFHASSMCEILSKKMQQLIPKHLDNSLPYDSKLKCYLEFQENLRTLVSEHVRLIR